MKDTIVDDIFGDNEEVGEDVTLGDDGLDKQIKMGLNDLLSSDEEMDDLDGMMEKDLDNWI